MGKQLRLPAPASLDQAREQHYRVIRAKFERAVHDIAGNHCIQAWDDEGFAAHIEGIVRHWRARMIGGSR